MNITVIAFYEDHWMPPGTDLAQWDHLTRAYGANLQMIRDWSEAEIPVGSWIVLLDETGYTDLATIGDIDTAIAASDAGVMPEDITLIFGRTAQDLLTSIPEADWHYAFKITTPQAIPMFGVNACAIALFALDQWARAQG